MGKKKKVESDKKEIIKGRHKTSEECKACILKTGGCDRGIGYARKAEGSRGKILKGVVCFK